MRVGEAGAGRGGREGSMVYVRGNNNTGKQTHEGKRASCAAATQLIAG